MPNPQQELIWRGRLQVGDELDVYGDACYAGRDQPHGHDPAIARSTRPRRRKRADVHPQGGCRQDLPGYHCG